MSCGKISFHKKPFYNSYQSTDYNSSKEKSLRKNNANRLYNTIINIGFSFPYEVIDNPNTVNPLG